MLQAARGAYVAPLSAIYEATAVAIEALGELELVRYDDAPIDDSADLSLWEEMAPVVGATLASVNALLAEVDKQFPGDMLPADVTHARIHHIVQNVVGQLRTDVAAFGMRVRALRRDDLGGDVSVAGLVQPLLERIA